MLEDVFSFVPKRFRRRFLPIALSLLLRTVLDLFSIAVIVPFLMMLFDREAAVAVLPDRVVTSIPLLLAVLLLVIVVKWLATVFLDRYQNRFLLELYRFFFVRMFRAQFSRGYQYVKEHNKAEIAYKVNTICYMFCLNVLMPFLALLTESFVALAVLVTVSVLSPFSALALLAAVAPSALLYVFLVRRKISLFGEREVRSRSRIMHLIVDTFRGYPDMVVNGLFGKQEKQLNGLISDVSANRIDYTTVSRLPSALMEVSVVICLSILVLLNMWRDLQLGLTLACLGVATLRLLPAVKSIIASWSTLRNNREVVSQMVEGLRHSADAGPSVAENSSPAGCFRRLKVENLTFSFEDGNPVVENLSFEVNRGERIGIVGPSGVGKSTLMSLLLGLYEPDSGSVTGFDENGRKISLEDWRSMIGYVPQDVFLFNATIAENIAIDGDFEYDEAGRPIVADRERLDECIRQSQLREFVDTLPDGVYTRLGDAGCKISGGQKQRIGIARALWKHPQILFFDEATNALDTETEASVVQAVSSLAASQQSLTMLFVSHRESSLQICTRFLRLGK